MVVSLLQKQTTPVILKAGTEPGFLGGGLIELFSKTIQLNAQLITLDLHFNILGCALQTCYLCSTSKASKLFTLPGTFVYTALWILLWEKVQVVPLIFLHQHIHTLWKSIKEGGAVGACACANSLSMKECSSLLATSTGCKTLDKWSIFIYTWAVKHLLSWYLSWIIAQVDSQVFSQISNLQVNTDIQVRKLVWLF